MVVEVHVLLHELFHSGTDSLRRSADRSRPSSRLMEDQQGKRALTQV
jgi:hypothetical protein